MGHISRDSLIDYSNNDEFCFALRCQECGAERKSLPIPYSKSGITPPSRGKQVVFSVLYGREKDAAMTRAIGELNAEFNLCPICRSLVCDHCFMVCDEIDMCTACALELQERGEPVAQRAL